MDVGWHASIRDPEDVRLLRTASASLPARGNVKRQPLPSNPSSTTAPIDCEGDKWQVLVD